MNQWDNLTDIFGSRIDSNNIPPSAADNIYIAWPSIIKCINEKIERSYNSKALDFGCGNGLFCNELYKMGFNTSGYDKSKKLVDLAIRNTPDEVNVTNSDISIWTNKKYSLITSIMVFQFIDDLEPVIDNMISSLEGNGVIIFAVFNPEFIKDNQGNKMFLDFTKEQSGFMELKKGHKIPVYSRTESYYRNIFENKEFEQIHIDYPIFTKEFLSQYKMPFSTDFPEYLIQAFKKKIT